MSRHQRATSPHSRNKRMHAMDPLRASTGTLHEPYHDLYPAAPAPPQRTPYSTNPHSPRSSGESLGYPSMPGGYYGAPGGTVPTGPVGSHPPPSAPAPSVPHEPLRPVGNMRGGDSTHGRPTRRNTLSSANRPVIHNYDFDYPPADYAYPPALTSQPPIHPQKSRSSSHTRDISPPSSGEGFTMVSGPGGASSRRTTYHPGSSSYSAGSYPERERQKGYILSSGSRHGRGNNREYHLNGPPPGERDFRREGGTVYHPGDSSRPVLSEPRRERSMSRGPSGRTPMTGSGAIDTSEEESDFEDDLSDDRRPASAGAAPSGSSNALVKPRSRSVSRSRAPKSTSGAVVPHKKDDSKPPVGGGIRLEYAGNSFDITYTDAGGKPLSIGSITINTTSRTTAVPISSSSSSSGPASAPSNAIAAPSNAIAAPSNAIAALPAPPPADSQHPVAPVVTPAPPPLPQATMPPPGIAPVLIPAPPPPQAIPPLGGPIATPVDPVREGLYRTMANLAIEDRPASDDYMGHPPLGSPMGQPLGSPMSLEERGREFERAPLAPILRRRSRSAGAAHDLEPRWTKISRDIVARRAVEVLGYDFEERTDSIIIFQVLEEAEIDELIDLSERIRSGEIRVIRREREPEPRPAKSGSSRRRSKHRRPLSIHGALPGPGPSANRPPPGKPAIVQNSATASAPAPPAAPAPPEVPTAPPIAEAPAPPPAPSAPKGPSVAENAGSGRYVGYVRNPPAASYGPYQRGPKRG